MSKRRPPESKDLKAIWAEESRLKAQAERIEAAQADTGVYSSGAKEETEELKSDWQQLIIRAKAVFPEHLAAKYQITPDRRLAAIAFKLGWTKEKIAEASTYGVSTIYRWLSLPEVVEFMNALDYHLGSKDAKEMIDKEQYSSLRVIAEIRDNPDISATTRLDAAKWLYEQKHGKAKESREVTGINLKDLTQQLMKAKEEQLRELANVDDLLDDKPAN